MKAQQKLEAAGYHVTFCMSGTVIAKKGQHSYTGTSVSSLAKKILG